MFEGNNQLLNFITENGNAPVIIYISSKRMNIKDSDFANKLCEHTGTSFDLCEIVAEDWDSMLTPWRVDRCLENREFSGEAKKFLDFIVSEIIPEIDKKYKNHRELYIAGYSLAGLFSLWSLYECDVFDGAVCCSGSLWYPGWDEFVTKNAIAKKAKVYLSLGDKESCTKNSILRTVGERTKRQYDILGNDSNVTDVIFEHNKGGHFADVESRVIKGIGWILDRTN